MLVRGFGVDTQPFKAKAIIGTTENTTTLDERFVTLPESLRGLIIAQMPLAEMPVRVASPSQDFGQRDEALVERGRVLGRNELAPLGLAALRAADRVDAVPRPILPGHQAGACRGAVGGVGVGVGEPHALRSQTIDIRRVVNLAAVARDVAPAQIVGEDEHDVGSRLRRRYAAV